jgi:hypothetical protein
MQQYILNFFVWWYKIVVKGYFRQEVLSKYVFYLNKTNALPMAKNLFTPMFRDSSSFGKNISVFIRFWWVGIGTLYSSIVIIPRVLVGLVLISLPFLPLIQVLLFILNRG